MASNTMGIRPIKFVGSNYSKIYLYIHTVMNTAKTTITETVETTPTTRPERDEKDINQAMKSKESERASDPAAETAPQMQTVTSAT